MFTTIQKEENAYDCFFFEKNITRRVRRPRGGLPYITDGDARRNFQKKPLKVTIFGVAPANFIP